MEHVIQEHEIDIPKTNVTEKVLHCMSCGDWVSTQDSAEIVAEFKGSPCPGTRQHDEEDGECIEGLKFYSQSRLYGRLIQIKED